MNLMLLFLLTVLSPVDETKTTTIEANTVHYDGVEIYLSGDVQVSNAMGTVKAERAYLKKDVTGKSKIDFPWLELSQNVVATFANQGLLTCDKVTCDYEQMKSRFSSSKEVHYCDPRGEIFAKSAVCDYEESEAGIVPIKITMTEGVRMVHKEGAEQYALADCVEYYPKEEIVILKSKENDHVLFFDQTNGVQLSATEVKAKRGSTSGKESIQGIGDVCFTFKEEELNKLKKYFTWK